MKLDISHIEMSRNDLRRETRLPNELTQELAEFIGIMLGDGHLGYHVRKNKTGSDSIQYLIHVSGNKEEKYYIEHVRSLFYQLFNVKLYYTRDQKALAVKVQSKGIFQFLHSTCEIPKNYKCDKITIPTIIKSADNEIKHAFLRGLADTDFTIGFKNRTGKGHNYPVIRASFKSKPLILDLSPFFKELGFSYCGPYHEKKYDKRFKRNYPAYSLYLNGHKNFQKWIKHIGSSHLKFQTRIKKWQKDGICPPGYGLKAPGGI